MRVSTLVFSTISAAALLMGGTATAQAASAGPAQPPAPTRQQLCADGKPATQPAYWMNEKYLGPATLPALTGTMLGYQRYGSDKSLMNFIARNWDPKGGAAKTGGWKYPVGNGFTLDFTNKPVMGPLTLKAGEVIDRFGSANGRFLSPVGTTYAARALPPSSLNPVDDRYPYGYRAYKVAKPFAVEAGKTASAFGQPGGGQQDMLDFTALSSADKQILFPAWKPGMKVPALTTVQLCVAGYLDPTSVPLS